MLNANPIQNIREIPEKSENPTDYWKHSTQVYNQNFKINETSLLHLEDTESHINKKNGSNFITTPRNELLTSLKCTVTVVGLIGNVITLITLSINGKDLPIIGRCLLIHQATVDTFVCIMSLGMYIQPFMWMTGNTTFDFLLCQIWHGQPIYWGAVLLSVWNVVLIAHERFMLILHPFKHQTISITRISKVLAMLYVLSIVCLLPAYLQVMYDSNSKKCLNVYYIQTYHFHHFMQFYGVFWFFIVYAIPITILIVLYTKIIVQLRGMYQVSEIFTSQEDDNQIYELADRQITKTAIAIAVAFIVSIGWDAFYCLLGFTGIIKYEFNKPLQVVGVFLSTLNSCTTPFIFAAFMPIFRNILKETFYWT